MSATEPLAAFLTALPLEYAAVKALITDVEEAVHPEGTYAAVGRIPGVPWRIAVVWTDVGSLSAATVTMRVNAWLRPQAAFYVGIAGALHDDLDIGDVVVATRVYGIHGGKLKGGRFDVRPAAWPIPHRLEQAAHAALGDKAAFKPVAVGDVVLADDEAELREFLGRHYNDAVALETEGTGFAHAAHISDRLDAVIIRAISDKAGADKERTDKEGAQRVAAAAAAEAAVTVLRKLRPQDRSGSAASPDGRRGGNITIYGGDHTQFNGTFNAPVIGKVVNQADPEHERS